MEDLTVRRAVASDRAQIIALYDAVIEDTEGKPTSPRWVKGLHPSEAEIDAAIAGGTMFVGLSAPQGGVGPRVSQGGSAAQEPHETCETRQPTGRPQALQGGSAAQGSTRQGDAGGGRDGRIVAALIADANPADGYENVTWSFDAGYDEVAVIHLFAVSPAIQHGGVGTRFVKGVFGMLAADGKRGVRLDTLEGNEPARRFYAKLGMNYLGVHTLKYHDPRVTRFHIFDLAF